MTTAAFLDRSSTDSGQRWWDGTVIEVGSARIEMLVVSDGDAITGVHFGGPHAGAGAIREGWVRDRRAVREAVEQLGDYADGNLKEFDLPLRPNGTPFQMDVWEALTSIPYGTTTSYGAIARDIGRPGSGRAVGSAVGSNPIAIVVPCHRVIGSNGALTGFGGGLENKVALLRREGVTAF